MKLAIGIGVGAAVVLITAVIFIKFIWPRMVQWKLKKTEEKAWGVLEDMMDEEKGEW